MMKPIKIAFTSCFDAQSDTVQEVWNAIKKHQPNGLILHGDAIYMDWGWWGERPIGWLRKLDLSEKDLLNLIAKKMYENYQRQWQVPSFRDLIRSVCYVSTVWDDHDFLWNQSAGAQDDEAPGQITDPDFRVTRNQRKIARALHLQFRTHLCPQHREDDYSPMPSLEKMLSDPDQNISTCNLFGDVRVIMLDGRYHRGQRRTGGMLSPAQHLWLEKQYQDGTDKPPRLTLIATGSTLTGSADSWEKYNDFQRFLNYKFPRTIVLTGDIHKNILHNKNDTRLPYHEITASGAARPLGHLKIDAYVGKAIVSLTGKGAHASGNFGLIDVLLDYDKVRVRLFKDCIKAQLCELITV